MNQIVKKFKRNRIFDFAKQRRKIKCVCFHSFFRKETNKQKQNKFKVEKSDWCFICREHHSIIYWHISMSKSTRKFSKNVFFPLLFQMISSVKFLLLLLLWNDTKFSPINLNMVKIEHQKTRRSLVDLFWSGHPPKIRERWNQLAARCLTLLFINLSLWILAALAFKIVEGGLESSFKCGNSI